MAYTYNGSPTPRKAAAQFMIHDDEVDEPIETTWPLRIGGQVSSGVKRTNSSTNLDQPVPLTTSRLINQQQLTANPLIPSKKTGTPLTITNKDQDSSPVDQLLNYLTSGSNVEKPKSTQGSDSQTGHSCEASVNDNSSSDDNRLPDGQSGVPVNYTSTTTAIIDKAELSRLKKELEAAHEKLASIGHIVPHNRNIEQPRAHFIGPPSDSGSHTDSHFLSGPTSSSLQMSQYGAHSQASQADGWSQAEDALSDQSREFSPFGAHQATWPNDFKFGQASLPTGNTAWNPTMANPWTGRNGTNNIMQQRAVPAPQPRKVSNLRLDAFDRFFADNSGVDQGINSAGLPVSRPGSAFQGHNPWSSYPASIASSAGFSPPMTPMSFQPSGVHQPHYQPRPIGTPLSPTAVEFNDPWNPQPTENSPTYVPPVEPMNYRRLLDRNMSCNWKYIVDKIVCNNDQQASIFLQQKLKVATPEQKYEMVEAIITQAYPLMINRFGNFLIQRCFEHGTPEQVIAIANTIRGNTLALSMDAFGCHVVQKAFDAVPEDYKAIMVHELLRRIPETVIHRYACHVWQKLFELRWSDSPPQIMKYVNEALRGMWHEVALGETGSLVVQNIFENCLEEDKRPCINEVLASIDIVSHGQFGNWCIQHICEHGAPADRGRATDHVIRFATEYSMDQFASKVAEKCLKVGGNDFLDRYLERVCEARPDRPRMPLIDIAGDQYGNYLVQYILISSPPQHRETVVNHVRKHMVSLQGSKFGSRVAMICCNPAFATRPGPPTGVHGNRFMPTSTIPRPGYGGSFR